MTATAAGARVSAARRRPVPGRHAAWLRWPALLWLSACVAAPVLLLLALSFARRGPAGEVIWSFTWDNYRGLARPHLWPMLVRSIGIAALTTLLAVAAALPFAWIAARSGPRRQRLWLLFLAFPMAVNLILRLYAFVLLLRADGWINAGLQALGLAREPLALLYTPWATALGLAYNFLPFAAMPLFAAASRVDWACVEAAIDLGASPAQVFGRVLWPLSLPGVAAAVLLVFLPSLTLFVAPAVLGGNRGLLLGNWIEYQFLSARDWPAGAALAIALLLVLALAYKGAARLARGTVLEEFLG